MKTKVSTLIFMTKITFEPEMRKQQDYIRNPEERKDLEKKIEVRETGRTCSYWEMTPRVQMCRLDTLL